MYYRRSCKKQFAFTLIEIMPAIIIAAIIIITALSALRIVQNSRSNQQYYSQLNASLVNIFEIMHRDIACLYWPEELQWRRLQLIPSPDKADRFTFYTIAPDKGPGDIMQVEFGLVADSSNDSYWLGYRIAPVEDLTQGNDYGRVGRLLDNVKSFKVEFYESNRWLDRFDDQESCPQKIKVKLVIADPQGYYPDYYAERIFIIKDAFALDTLEVSL